MSKPLVSDELWEAIEPLLPVEPPKPQGGRPRVPDRATLTGIVFLLRSGIPWELLPQEMGCGSGGTCWRRVGGRAGGGGGGRAPPPPLGPAGAGAPAPLVPRHPG